VPEQRPDDLLLGAHDCVAAADCMSGAVCAGDLVLPDLAGGQPKARLGQRACDCRYDVGVEL
jgi:hypothetical protein